MMNEERLAPSHWQLLISNWQLAISKVWVHAQHELLYISWGLMEIAIFAPLSFALLRWAHYWPPEQIILWLLLLMFLPFNLVRLMSLLEIPTSRQQTANALILIFIILLSIRTLIYAPQTWHDTSWIADFFANIGEAGNSLWLRDLAIFFIIIIMWQRGLRLSNRQFNLEQTGYRLRMGVIIAPIAIWFSRVGQGWNATPFILLYFLAGLTALSLVRADEMERARTGFSASLSPHWLAYIFGASLLTVTLGGLLAALISGESLFAIAGWMAPLLGAFYLGGTVIVSTILYLGQPVITLFATIIDWLALRLQQFAQNNWIDPQIPTVDFTELMGTPAATDIVEVIAPPSFNTRILAILLMVTAVLIVSLALGKLFRQASFAARESDRVGGKEQPGEAQPGMGRRLLRRLGLWRKWRAAASVRRIYRDMLKAAEENGFPRGESETPYEFLSVLAQIWPENQADSNLITQAFVKVRYGELPETQAELDVLEAAWERLKEAEPAQLDSSPHLEKRLVNDRTYNAG